MYVSETAFVGLPSAERRWIISLHKVVSFSHYFRKYFKLMYRNDVVVVTFTTGIMFLLFTCIHFRLWVILRSLSAGAPIACEVVRDCRKSEKHWSELRFGNKSLVLTLCRSTAVW
jgi:hypothetical protein